MEPIYDLIFEYQEGKTASFIIGDYYINSIKYINNNQIHTDDNQLYINDNQSSVDDNQLYINDNQSSVDDKYYFSDPNKSEKFEDLLNRVVEFYQWMTEEQKDLEEESDADLSGIIDKLEEIFPELYIESDGTDCEYIITYSS